MAPPCQSDRDGKSRPDAVIGHGGRMMDAGARAKAIETRAGTFPSLTMAAAYFGISRKRGARQIKSGRWRFIPLCQDAIKDVRSPPGDRDIA